MFTRITAIVAVCLAVAGFAFGVVKDNSAHSQNIQLSREVSNLRSQLTTLQSASDTQFRSINGQLSGLTQPTDPLANYNYVCNTQLTNDQTGNIQTYYYPCTNQVQTIPQPGN